MSIMGMYSLQGTDGESWNDIWKDLQKKLKGMSAEAALMYIMFEVFPDLSGFYESEMKSEGNSMNDLSNYINDLNSIQDEFNNVGNGSEDSTEAAKKAMEDAYNLIQEMKADGVFSSDQIHDFEEQFKSIFAGKYKPDEAPTSSEEEEVGKDWSKYWQEATDPDSGDQNDHLSTITNTFSQLASTFNGQSGEVQSIYQYDETNDQQTLGILNSVINSMKELFQAINTSMQNS